MKSLLLIKAQIKKFVGKNEVFITPLLKFLLTFIVLTAISNNIGFMAKLASKPIVLIVALAGSFLPVNLSLVIIALISVAHLYALSLEVAIVVLALYLVLFLLYFRFASQDSIAVLLTPIAFMMKIPYVIPISMGLVGTPSSMVSVASGVIVYNVLHYINVNQEALASGESLSLGAFKTVIDGVIANRDMIVLAGVFAATVLVVYIIRRLSINYCWLIAIACGALTLIIGTAVANAVLDGNVSVGGVFAGSIVAILINLVLWYFCFDLNYQKTEKVQFEDDEYYYYVKAVPKNDIRLKKSGKASKTKDFDSIPSARRPVATKPEGGNFERSHAEYHSPALAKKESILRSKPSNRAPLGLSGGRPAGEGRLKEEALRRAEAERIAKARADRNRETTNKIIEPLSEDEI